MGHVVSTKDCQFRFQPKERGDEVTGCKYEAGSRAWDSQQLAVGPALWAHSLWPCGKTVC